MSANDLQTLILESMLPEIHHEFGQESECKEFEEHKERCKTNFSNLLSLIKSNEYNESQPLPEKVVVLTVLLCGEHSESNSWTNAECIEYANEVLQKILEDSSASNVLSLMLTHKIQSFFNALNPKLLKKTWKNYPAAISCFKWIVFKVECPHFEDIFPYILTTCLLMIDDHEIKNKVLGLQCLTHLEKNMSFSDLEQFGRRSLIYSALEHMIYLREPEIIRPLASCLIALLCKTEPGYLSTCTQWTHLDDVLNVWLPSMDLEQRLALREAYMDSLEKLLEVMGLAVVRWSDKLLNIFTEYSLTKHTQHKALKALSTFIHIAWPRIQFHFEDIFTILMKNAMDLIHQDLTQQEEESHQLIKKCLLTLEESSKSQYDVIVQQLKDNADLANAYIFVSNN